MGNCLVTRLKGVVDNDMLPKIGELYADCYVYGESPSLNMANSGGTVTLRFSGGIKFSTSVDGELVDEHTYAAAGTIVNLSNKAYFATEKESFRFFIKNADNLLALGLTGSEGGGYHIHNTSAIKNIRRIAGPLWNHSLVDFSQCVLCTSFNSTLNVISSVEDYIEGNIANGRSSASASSPILITGFLLSVTMNGRLWPKITKTGSGFLTFESSTKYALYVALTSLSTATYIYVRGYSAEEITELTNNGKTVCDVETGTVYPPTN